MNLPLSLATKYALSRSYSLINNEGIKDVYKYSRSKLRSLNSLQDFDEFHSFLPSDMQERFSVYNWVEKNGVRYKSKVKFCIQLDLMNNCITTALNQQNHGFL